ncbi:MAG: DUF4405 domain-containing protein [Pontiellaceae bacterium]|nr:DUF4405 domain-containing protein [Pontiellaceae bacterium]MBN2786413.1 DUF4405 domain-containing protein [Pontiellaceae bacterium]
MRKVTSLTLLIAGFIELVTSVVLYMMPAGRVAYWSEYRFLGLSKNQWGGMHITVGTLLLVLIGLHIFYNWKPILTYLKNKAKQLTVFNRSFNIALLLSLYVTVGTLFNLPPMSFVLMLGEHLTEQGNAKYGEPPYGHAELSSLAMFCSKMRIDPESAGNLLKDAGIEFSGRQETLAEIAAENGKTPQQIYDIIRPGGETVVGTAAFPDSPVPGFGKETIRGFCGAYGLPVDAVLNELHAAGFTAGPDDSMRTIAESQGGNPMKVFEVIQRVAEKQQ